MKPREPNHPEGSADPLERALHAALRPLDPGTAFVVTVQARLAGRGTPPQIAAPRSPARPRYQRWYLASLAAAAAIVLGVGIAAQIAELRGEQRAALARAEQARIHTQLLLALEITSERLGMAQQRIEQYQAQERHP